MIIMVQVKQVDSREIWLTGEKDRSLIKKIFAVQNGRSVVLRWPKNSSNIVGVVTYKP